jgi:hypothetical protein
MLASLIITGAVLATSVAAATLPLEVSLERRTLVKKAPDLGMSVVCDLMYTYTCDGGSTITSSDCARKCVCNSNGDVLCKTAIGSCSSGTVQLFCEGYDDPDPECGCVSR